MNKTAFTLLAAFAASSSFAIAQEPAAAATPPVERGLKLATPAALDGYTLFSPIMSGTTFLIDMQGQIVHRWDTGLAPGNMAYLLDNGNLLRGVRDNDNPRFFGGGLAGRIQELEWDGKVVWDYKLSDDQRVLHHDLELMPNGNILAIAWEYVSHDDAQALGRDPKAINEKGWWPDSVLELQPVKPNDAKIVWEWHAKDHLIQDFDRTKPGFGSVPEHPELIDINADHRGEPALTREQIEELAKRKREMKALGYTGGDDEKSDDKPKADAQQPIESDWLHCNGLDYNPALDLIVVSSPHLSEVFVLDHSTTSAEARTHAGGKRGHGGDLLYRWGNPKNYGLGTKEDRKLFYQHDPNWIQGANANEWHITCFNNGQDRPAGKFSSIEEIVPPFDATRGFTRNPGWAFGPDAPAWHYEAPERESLFSFIISGAQRLSNGDTLICVGVAGRFLEVTRDGKTVWEYLNPFGGEIPHSFGKAAPPRDGPSPVAPIAVFQAARIAKDHPGLRGRKLTPVETH
jgi:hypothetical protein